MSVAVRGLLFLSFLCFSLICLLFWCLVALRIRFEFNAVDLAPRRSEKTIQPPTSVPFASTVIPPPTSLSSLPSADSRDDGEVSASQVLIVYSILCSFRAKNSARTGNCSVRSPGYCSLRLSSRDDALRRRVSVIAGKAFIDKHPPYGYPSSSCLEKTIRLHCSSYHHSESIKPHPVSPKMCSSSPTILLLDVCVTIIASVSESSSNSSSTLLMDVCEAMSGIEINFCRAFPCICSAYHSTTIRRLSPYSPWSKLNPKLMNLGDMHRLLVGCRTVLDRTQCLNLGFFLEPSSSSLDSWPVYHGPWAVRSALGSEEPTDDLLSVLFNGSTLLSAAVIKIVRSVLDAVTVSDGCSCGMFLTSTRLIPLPRLNDEETRGHLFVVRCFGIMNLPILCSFFFRLLFATPIVLALRFLNCKTIDVTQVSI